MKTAISIPDPIFRKGDKLAKRLGVSRSHLYAMAVQRLIDAHDDDAITAAIDRVLADQTSELDPTIQQLQARTLAEDSWK
ncbi:MAG: ChpI protein [Acidobacteriota bacterium]